MDFPEAGIIRVRNNRDFPGYVIVTINCPLCHQEHTHGLTRKELTKELRSHRVAHCGMDITHSGGVYGYYIVLDKDGLKGQN